MPPDRIALGAYVRGYPTDRQAMDRYAELVGRWPAIVHIFRNWTDATRDFDPELAATVTARDSRLMISWQPPPGDLRPIAEGAWDEYVIAYARAIAAASAPTLLRFAHEMNGEWIPWRSSPESFRAAWRHVHAIFAAESADTVRWVWSPHVPDPRAERFEPYYPSHDLVDWVALDGYNWGRSQPHTRWRDFDQVFASAYGDLVEMAPGKPVMLAEIGSAEEGGDKAAWIREAFGSALPARYPKVAAVAWFHAFPRGHADWRVDSSPSALAAWRGVVADPLMGLTGSGIPDPLRTP